MPPFFESEIVWRLVVATFLGAAFGFERSLAGKHAGMRTYALATMGSCLFTVAGVMASYQFAMFAGVSPLALAGFVIVGIGFIGAGLSATTGGNSHAELTTATGIWVAAGIGLAVGFGFYNLAVAAAVLGVLIFSTLAKIEHYLRVRFGSHYTETNNG